MENKDDFLNFYCPTVNATNVDIDSLCRLSVIQALEEMILKTNYEILAQLKGVPIEDITSKFENEKQKLISEKLQILQQTYGSQKP